MEFTPGTIVSMLVSATVAAAVAVLFVLWFRSREQAGGTHREAQGGPPSMEEVERLAASGRKIQAIKVYRELHGVGLKEAKEAVERMSRP